MKKIFSMLSILVLLFCNLCGCSNKIEYSEYELKPYAVFYDDNGYMCSSYYPVIWMQPVSYRYDGKPHSVKVIIEQQCKIIHSGTEDEAYINGDRNVFAVVYSKDGVDAMRLQK